MSGAARGSAQSPAATADSTTRLRVFLDCKSHYCDFDYFRTEIGAVSWVRDRAEADVHVLVVNEETGAGGQRFTLAFLGAGRFATKDDTLRYSSRPAAVEDEVRSALAQTLRVGLVPFVALASGYDAVGIEFKGGTTNAEATQRDPWHAWVFNASLNGFGSGDKTSKSMSTSAELAANRITERWKTSLSLNGSYDDSKYELSDSSTYTNIQRNYSLEFEQVRSVGGHVAVGVVGGVGSSTFSNQKRTIKLAPAVEYDVFPYTESSRRRLTLQYAAGVARYVYVDTTIFDKLRETVAVHSFQADARARQPWGSLGLRALYRAQITDPAKRRLSLSGNVNVRVLKGLSVNVGGNVANIRDQIYLPREEATDEEILVRQRERATSYRYFMHFGIEYTFGSIFNNIVNPRFDSIDFF